MKNVILKIEGMSCSHCENAVKGAVGALEGVDKVTVSLKEKTVTVDYDSSRVSPEQMKAVIEGQGYEVL
jgi:copper chaperone